MNTNSVNMENPLYIEDAQKILGRQMKHPAMIKKYQLPNYNITSTEPTKFLGVDFETDAKTGKIMLFGVWFQERYYSYDIFHYDLLDMFCFWVKMCIEKNYTMVHWTKFDQNAIAKMFIEKLSNEEKLRTYERYDRASGLFSNGEWVVPPVCSYTTTIKGKEYDVGINFLLDKKMMNIFLLQKDGKYPLKMNIINMHSLYKINLTNATANDGLDYYDKMNEGYVKKGIKYSYHIIDWDLYQQDTNYRQGVLKSNMLDCKAVKDLSDIFIQKFYKVFKCYPKIIYSSGTLAKMALSSILSEEEYSSLNFVNQLKDWNYEKNNEQKQLCDYMTLMACEAYSGGLFETYAIGSGDCYIADISACYSASISKLLDLKGSKLIKGVGEPPKPAPNEYIFIYGEVDVDKKIIHTFSIHHPDYPNIITRPYGKFYSTYIWEEREFARLQGATFNNEEYIIIKTNGNASPLAKASKELYKIRNDLRKKKDSAQSIAKDAGNSCYGITIEGVPLYKYKEGKYVFDGFRAGSLFNPVLAALITAYGRILLCTAMLRIKQNGGMLIQANTDSIHWKGKKNDLPKNFNTLIGPSGWREEKIVGYFEEPTHIKEFISLSTGRYGGYDTLKKKYITKLRGYIVEGNNKHNLKEILNSNKDLEICNSIALQANEFISIKLSKNRTALNLSDVCTINTRDKDLKLISIEGKRICKLATEKNPIKDILSKYTKTEAFCTETFYKDCNKKIKKLRDMVISISKTGTTKGEKRKLINQNPLRKEKAKLRAQKYRKNMSPEQREIKRKRDRERWRKKNGLTAQETP